jgi:hypothetical protein
VTIAIRGIETTEGARYRWKIHRAAALPHNGIATFCKALYVFKSTEIDAEVAVLGIPFDNTASMQRTLTAAIEDKCERM